MIFKTLNGDLTVFNKILISTKDHLKALQTVNTTVYNKNGAFNLQGLLIHSSQSVSTFTKLNNAFKTYNGNLSKSTQLQNAYVQAIGKQNVTLGNYLAGLNGAKASMGGYVKSLVAAKATSIGLQAASIALNTAISMGITLAISGLISQISKWIHAQEQARQKAIDLTNSYKEQRNSLDSQIEKYKELKENLDKGNLSTDETRSIKEQLLEIQKSLIESYGDEASNIDLANGKYREQLGLLSELSKEKATDYVTENRDVFSDAKESLEKIRKYDIGFINWSTISPETEDQRKLIEYIESYSKLLDLTYSGSTGHGVTSTSANIAIKADVESADEIMHQLAEDLERYGKDNNIDVSGLLEGISEQLKKTWTDELTDYKTVYDEFMKAEIVRNDTLRPLYQQSIQAVEDYNNALSSGKGIDEAKANLDAIQQSVQNATGELEGSQEVFDGIYDGINKSAESAYNLGQAFGNDESVKGYTEKLKGLTDIDLQAINFKDNVQSPGEEAFGALIDILGVSEDEVQNLIDKLIELGYVQGEVQDSTSNIENPISTSLSDTITQLNTQLKPTFDSLKSTYQDIFTEDGKFALNSIDILSTCDSIKSKLDDMAELGLDIDYSSYEDFVRVLRSSESTEQNVKDAFNSLAASITSAGLSGAEDFETLKAALEDLGVVNEELVAFESLISNTEALKEAGLDLTSATDEQINAFANEMVSSENVSEAIAMLTFQKELCGLQDMNTAGEVANLLTLAENAGYTGEVIEHLTELEQIYQQIASGTLTPGQLDAKLARAEELRTLIKESAGKINYEPKVDFKGAGGKKSAGTAGKEAADTYLEAFEKELKDLDDLKSDGKISEKQYLDALRRLYLKYFRDKEKYLKEYEKYEHQYLEGMKSLYESAFSYITKQIDKRIDAVNSQKDAAVSALEAERDARLEAIEAQKEQYEHEIEGIEAQIDAREKEIKAMQDANGERKRAIDLQKAEYELQRMQNQKTSFVYKDGQMVYEADTSGIRDAKQEVEDAKLEIDISKIEKEIDRLEEEKDLLQERIDLLDKEAEQVNQYYDQLIAQTEKHYDAMVKGLEDYKSQFEALTDLLENAQLEASLSELGISMDALLSGSQEEFEKLKTAYIGILADMSRGNDGVLEQLSRLSGISTESISYLNAAKGAFESLGAVTLGGLEESIALLNSITFPEIGDEGYEQKPMRLVYDRLSLPTLLLTKPMIAFIKVIVTSSLFVQTT